MVKYPDEFGHTLLDHVLRIAIDDICYHFQKILNKNYFLRRNIYVDFRGGEAIF